MEEFTTRKLWAGRGSALARSDRFDDLDVDAQLHALFKEGSPAWALQHTAIVGGYSIRGPR